jgi:hypothetical protein
MQQVMVMLIERLPELCRDVLAPAEAIAPNLDSVRAVIQAGAFNAVLTDTSCRGKRRAANMSAPTMCRAMAR